MQTHMRDEISNFLPSAEDFDFPAKLKMTCEQFIMSVTNVAIEPMLSFITKVSAIKVSVQNRSLVTEGSKALKEQAFPTPDKVAQMVATVKEAKKVQLPEVVKKMELCLQNQFTCSIFFEPIKSNIFGSTWASACLDGV